MSSHPPMKLPTPRTNPYKELVYQIKLTLYSCSRQDPDTRIELPFDKLLYAGGLEKYGTKVCRTRGGYVYTIRWYGNLVPLLGELWHVRGINDHVDFCYVNLETVQYYLYECKPIADFRPASKELINGSSVLVFSFCTHGRCKVWCSS